MIIILLKRMLYYIEESINNIMNKKIETEIRIHKCIWVE